MLRSFGWCKQSLFDGQDLIGIHLSQPNLRPRWAFLAAPVDQLGRAWHSARLCNVLGWFWGWKFEAPKHATSTATPTVFEWKTVKKNKNSWRLWAFICSWYIVNSLSVLTLWVKEKRFANTVWMIAAYSCSHMFLGRLAVPPSNTISWITTASSSMCDRCKVCHAWCWGATKGRAATGMRDKQRD